MRRLVALLFSVLLGVAVAAIPGPAMAAVPGFDVTITELPGAFTAGQDPSTVTVVASTDEGRGCQKVRWSMVLRVNGLRLDQVRVERIEENGAFPLAVQADGDTARLTDVRFDPGTLCRGRTVTARYKIAIADEATDGEVTMVAEAYDRRERLLQQAQVTREVVGDGQDAGEPTPSEEPSEEPSDEATVEPEPDPETEASDDAAAGDSVEGAGPGAVAAVPAAGQDGGDSSLVILGATVGSILIFLGVGLLMRMRLRNRAARRMDPLESAY